MLHPFQSMFAGTLFLVVGSANALQIDVDLDDVLNRNFIDNPNPNPNYSINIDIDQAAQ